MFKRIAKFPVRSLKPDEAEGGTQPHTAPAPPVVSARLIENPETHSINRSLEGWMEMGKDVIHTSSG